MRTRVTISFLLLAFSVLSYAQNAQIKNAGLQSKELRSNIITLSKGVVSNKPAFLPDLFIEDFENGIPPEGWQVRDPEGNGGWGLGNDAYTGSNSIGMYISASTDWLAAPRYSVHSGDSLIFYTKRGYIAQNDTLTVLVSELENVPYDEDSLNAAFSDTLLCLDMTQYVYDGWNRHSVSLEKFTNKSVYIAFKNVMNGDANIALDRVKIGIFKTSDIDIIPPSNFPKQVKIGNSFNGSLMVQNNGAVPMSFDVVIDMPAENYTYTEHIDDLAPDKAADVYMNISFNSVGEHKITMSIESSGDETPENDTLTLTISVYNRLGYSDWNTFSNMPYEVYGHATAYYDTEDGDPVTVDTPYAFVAGGMTATGFNHKLFRCDLNTWQWEEFGTMPETKFGISGALIKDSLYLIGGKKDSLHVSASVYIYDMRNNTWTQKADMPIPVWGYTAASYADSLIYVFGGEDESGNIRNEIQIYNAKKDAWTFAAAPLSHPVKLASALIVGDKIFLAGGRDAAEVFDEFNTGIININNPLNISWTSGKFFGGKRADMSAGYWYGENFQYIVFAGGTKDKDGQDYSSQAFAYDLQTGELALASDLNWPLAGSPNLISASRIFPGYQNRFLSFFVMGGHDPWEITNRTLRLDIGDDDPIPFEGTDVGIHSLNLQHKLDVSKAYTPRASVYNYKLMPQTLTVAMKIIPGDYYSEKTVTNLAFNVIADVQFDSWTPTETGSYDVTVYTILPGDSNSVNDTLKTRISVIDHIGGLFWTAETPKPFGMSYGETVSYVKKSMEAGKPDTSFIFVLGGYDSKGTNTSIYKYNTISRVWSKANTTMPANLHEYRAAQLGGKIYIPGGNTYPYESALRIYDVEADTIGKGADLPACRWRYFLGTYGDSLIYIMGGNNNESSQLNTVDIYNTKTNTWKAGTPFNSGVYLEGGTICGGKILLMEEYYDNNEQEYINPFEIGAIDPNDPYTITWTRGADFPDVFIEGVAAGSWYGKDKKYAVFTGGKVWDDTSEYYSPRTWIYDTEKDKWLEGPDKILPVAFITDLAPVVRNDSVYMAALGGETNNDNASGVNEWLYIGPNDPLTANGKDAAPVSIDFDTVIVNTAFIPKATFKNKQLTTQDVIVTMKITPGSYISVDTIEALAYNASQQVSFKTWTPDTAGTFTVKVYTYLSGDEDLSNDTLTSQVVVEKLIGTKNDLNDNLPKEYALEQNYPNPFNPVTKIKYALPKAGPVELKVYNMLGQEVATLVNEFKTAGYHEANFNAASLKLSSGVYIYRISAGSFVQAKKFVLLK